MAAVVVEWGRGGLLWGAIAGGALPCYQPVTGPEDLLRVECAQSLRHKEQSQISRPSN